MNINSNWENWIHNLKRSDWKPWSPCIARLLWITQNNVAKSCWVFLAPKELIERIQAKSNKWPCWLLSIDRELLDRMRNAARTAKLK